MQFTVLTPTFNRTHTLPRLYESLLLQNFKDLEWLIVDDGSSDGTKDLVAAWQAEKKIDIKYIFQENAGKHIAINTGLQHASGEWFFTVDSDDYLRENALETAVAVLEDLPQDFAGFTGIRFSDKLQFHREDFGKKQWTEGNYEWPYPGEMTFIWKTSVSKKYLFPVFPGEKFCQESLVIRRILAENKVLYTDHVLLGGDYLEDGLSQNLWPRMKASPRYSMLNYAERISQKTFKNKAEELSFAKNYWDIALSARHIPWSEKLTGISLPLTLRVFANKLLNKLRK